MKLKKFFITPENKIQPGLRIILIIIFFLLLSLIISTIIFFIIFLIFSLQNLSFQTFQNFIKRDYILASLQIFFYPFAFLLIYLFCRLLDKKTISSIGFSFKKSWFKQLCFGFVLGFFIFSAIIFISLIFKFVDFEKIIINRGNVIPQMSWLFFLFIFMASTSLIEEMLNRGYILNNLMEYENKWMAILISSGIFSLLHISNPGISILGLINIFLIGILLCQLYFLNKRLWIPIGFHFSWNFFEGCIYGFSVSGVSLPSLFRFKMSQATWLSGGKLGPEGSIITTILILILIFLFLYREKLYSVHDS